MRTPPAEFLLAEFRKQQEGAAAEQQPVQQDHALMDSNEMKLSGNSGIDTKPTPKAYACLVPSLSCNLIYILRTLGRKQCLPRSNIDLAL